MKVKAAVKNLTDIEPTIYTNISKARQSVVKNLTETYANLQSMLKAAYLSWATNPCSKKAEYEYNRCKNLICKYDFLIKKLEIGSRRYAENPRSPSQGPLESPSEYYLRQERILSRMTRTINLMKKPYFITINTPNGLQSDRLNRYSQMIEWLNSPLRQGDDPDSYQYSINGQITPADSNLRLNVDIYANRWYNQGNYPVGKDGVFEVLVYLHKAHPRIILRFEILKDEKPIQTVDFKIR